MKRVRSKTHPAHAEPRPRRRIHDEAYDVYDMREKLTDPSVCPQCQALYLEGRWVWKTPPAGATETICPACRRQADQLPAGLLTLSGSFLAAHRAEIEHLIRHVEQREKRGHPLHRIMEFETSGDEWLVSTTHGNLVRSMASALEHAYKGDAAEQSRGSEPPIRMRWHRD